MKLIIAGSRTIRWLSPDDINKLLIDNKISTKGLEIVSGTANGADKAGERFAEFFNLKLHKFPADWEGLGKIAGFVRNRQMADFADELLLIWDGESRGSAHMKRTMEAQNKLVHLVVFKNEN